MSVLAMQIPVAVPEPGHPDYAAVKKAHAEFHAQLYAMSHAVGGLTWTRNDDNGVYQITAGGTAVNARPSQVLVRTPSGGLKAMSVAKFIRKYEAA